MCIASIHKIRINPCVDILEELIKKLSITKGPVNVIAFPDLVVEMKNEPAIYQKFNALNHSRRKDICAYINSLKTQEARMKNVKKVIDSLRRIKLE